MYYITPITLYSAKIQTSHIDMNMMNKEQQGQHRQRFHYE